MRETIQARTLKFAVRLTKFVFRINKNFTMQLLFNQLFRSGTSMGANLEEADAAVSKKDFINKISISKKEARETRYWLIIIKEAIRFKDDNNNKDLEFLLSEVDELIRIIGAIQSKAKGNRIK